MNFGPARLAAALGADRAVMMTVLARGWSVVSGLLSVWLISHFLTPELQGYFFTLGSLLALQVLAELGLNQAIVHFASHEAAHLTWSVDGRLEGVPVARARLRALLAFGLAWFAAGGLALVVLLVPLGLHFLGPVRDPAAAAATSAWLWLAPLTAVNLLVAAALGLIEGCGRVAAVSSARLAQAVVSTLALWVGLASGAGLEALVLQAAGTLLTGVAWLLLFHRNFLRHLWAQDPAAGRLDWRHEIWPFQWRIAVSWISGFLIAQLFTPLLFANQGPVAAGRMGLALQVFGTLNMVAMAWISTQLPLYGQMIARGEGADLDRVFLRTLRQSTAVLVACLLLLLAALGLLEVAGSQLAGRLPSMPLMLVLALVALANHLIFAEAAILRAHKRDPFMGVSVASGLTTAILALAWIPEHGLAGATAAYAVATLVVGLGGGSVIFLRKRKAWWRASTVGAPART